MNACKINVSFQWGGSVLVKSFEVTQDLCSFHHLLERLTDPGTPWGEGLRLLVQGLYRERVFFERCSDGVLFDLSDEIPSPDTSYQPRLVYLQYEGDTNTGSYVSSFALITLSVALPLPPRLQEGGVKLADWDEAVALHRRHEKAQYEQRRSLTRTSWEPAEHRRLIDLRSIVFIGGNGSGKSRLIDYLANTCQKMQQLQPSGEHFSIERISARRKKLTSCMDEDPVVTEQRLADIFADVAARLRAPAQEPTVLSHEIEGLSEAIETIIKGNINKDSVITRRLGTLNGIYGRLFPQLMISVEGAQWLKMAPDSNGYSVVVQRERKKYSIHDLSDGEKEVFFLIWRVLSHPERGIILVDEPEAHLHRAAVDVLWSELERVKPLCFFAYFTHDLSFASTRMHSEIVCLHSYDHQNASWSWSLVPQQDAVIPTEVRLNIIGSRGQRVLFVEGDNYTSLDFKLYHEVYGRGWLVVPCKSCSAVIDSVKAITSKANPLLGHSVTAFGIIDRDRHPDEYFSSLDRVLPLEVAEVENFFCTEQVVRAVAARRQESGEATNEDDVWEGVRRNVLAFFTEGTHEFNEQIREYLKEESDGELQKQKDAIDCLDKAIKLLKSGAITKEIRQLAGQLKAEREKANAELAKAKRKEKTEEQLIGLARSGNVERILRTYNASKEAKRTWIGETVAAVLGLSQQDYVDAVFQILRHSSGRARELMQKAIKKYLPTLPAQEIRFSKYQNKHVIAELSGKQLKEQRALARDQGLYALELWYPKHPDDPLARLYVFKHPEQLTASDLGDKARNLLWKCCGLPKVRERSRQPDEVIAFFVQLEEENARKSGSQLPSPSIEQVRDAFVAAFFEKNGEGGLKQLLHHQRRRIQDWIKSKMSVEEEAKTKGKKKKEGSDRFYVQHEGWFISIDLKAANFAALKTLGYTGGFESWNELIDEVVGPVERVAALFHCKWFRQFALSDLLEQEVKREQRKVIGAVCQALRVVDQEDERPLLTEDNMVCRNRDEVIIRIDDTLREGQTEREFAAEMRAKVEKVLGAHQLLPAVRVEIFELTRREYDLITYAEKRNLENDSIQMKNVESKGRRCVPCAPV